MDDIISVWDHGEESLNSFSTHLNTLDANLHFTLELEDNHKLPFLDTLIFNKSLSLELSTYRKLRIAIGICIFPPTTLPA